jgi:integrase
MADLRGRDGFGARALEFCILTGTRSNEVRGALWSEIDLGAKLWSIPATRMKMKRPYRVPLSDAAMDLLKALPKMEGTDFVFPGRNNKPMSDASLNAAIDRMHKVETDAGRDGWLEDPDQSDPTAPRRVVVQHGFRSTFRDWVAEQTAYPRELAEMALAHVVGNQVEAAYQRGDLLEKRARLMADWAAFCTKVTHPE